MSYDLLISWNIENRFKILCNIMNPGSIFLCEKPSFSISPSSKYYLTPELATLLYCLCIKSYILYTTTRGHRQHIYKSEKVSLRLRWPPPKKIKNALTKNKLWCTLLYPHVYAKLAWLAISKNYFRRSELSLPAAFKRI